MDKKKTRMQMLRERREISGLVPLRITEIWCTPTQKAELRLKIDALIAEAIPKKTPD